MISNHLKFLVWLFSYYEEVLDAIIEVGCRQGCFHIFLDIHEEPSLKYLDFLSLLCCIYLAIRTGSAHTSILHLLFPTLTKSKQTHKFQLNDKHARNALSIHIDTIFSRNHSNYVLRAASL